MVGLEGSRFIAWQLYRSAASGSRKRLLIYHAQTGLESRFFARQVWSLKSPLSDQPGVRNLSVFSGSIPEAIEQNASGVIPGNRLQLRGSARYAQIRMREGGLGTFLSGSPPAAWHAHP